MKLTFAELRGIMPTIRKLTPFGLTIAANVLTLMTGKECDVANLKHFCKQYNIVVPCKQDTSVNTAMLIKDALGV